jgi:hypothetical protein
MEIDEIYVNNLQSVFLPNRYDPDEMCYFEIRSTRVLEAPSHRSFMMGRSGSGPEGVSTIERLRQVNRQQHLR